MLTDKIIDNALVAAGAPNATKESVAEFINVMADNAAIDADLASDAFDKFLRSPLGGGEQAAIYFQNTARRFAAEAIRARLEDMT